MKERILYLYIVSLVCAALGVMHSACADTVLTIICALTAVVLISAALLSNLLRRFVSGCVFTACALGVTLWSAGPEALPMAMAAVIVFFVSGAIILKSRLKFQRLWITIVIVYSVFFWGFRPESFTLITAALVSGFSVYALYLMDRLGKAKASAERAADSAEDLKEALGGQRRLTKSAEHVSRLEERNRLAARIHDEIGHGMSGSILLLEGADLVMDKDPKKARVTIRKVTENLRESVEKIRRVLREERPEGAEISLVRIKNELTAFETDYPHVKARLETSGDMSEIGSAVWICLYENMTEALTNMLKHSAATSFHVSLKNSGGLLRAEFADNGGAPAEDETDGERGQGQAGNARRSAQSAIRPGIGLQNMEERTALCYGRCFFRHEPDGFHIIMTFPRREE